MIFHLPIEPELDHKVLSWRTCRALRMVRLPSDAFARIRKLRLFQTYVSLQEINGKPRITAYLSPRFYQHRYGVFYAPQWSSPLSPPSSAAS
jgi:hypothetical protein